MRTINYSSRVLGVAGSVIGRPVGKGPARTVPIACGRESLGTSARGTEISGYDRPERDNLSVGARHLIIDIALFDVRKNLELPPGALHVSGVRTAVHVIGRGFGPSGPV